MRDKVREIHAFVTYTYAYARALTTYAYISSKEENTCFRKKHTFYFLLTRASEPRDHA